MQQPQHSPKVNSDDIVVIRDVYRNNVIGGGVSNPSVNNTGVSVGGLGNGTNRYSNGSDGGNLTMSTSDFLFSEIVAGCGGGGGGGGGGGNCTHSAERGDNFFTTGGRAINTGSNRNAIFRDCHISHGNNACNGNNTEGGSIQFGAMPKKEANSKSPFTFICTKNGNQIISSLNPNAKEFYPLHVNRQNIFKLPKRDFSERRAYITPAQRFQMPMPMAGLSGAPSPTSSFFPNILHNDSAFDKFQQWNEFIKKQNAYFMKPPPPMPRVTHANAMTNVKPIMLQNPHLYHNDNIQIIVHPRAPRGVRMSRCPPSNEHYNNELRCLSRMHRKSENNVDMGVQTILSTLQENPQNKIKVKDDSESSERISVTSTENSNDKFKKDHSRTSLNTSSDHSTCKQADEMDSKLYLSNTDDIENHDIKDNSQLEIKSKNEFQQMVYQKKVERSVQNIVEISDITKACRSEIIPHQCGKRLSDPVVKVEVIDLDNDYEDDIIGSSTPFDDAELLARGTGVAKSDNTESFLAAIDEIDKVCGEIITDCVIDAKYVKPISKEMEAKLTKPVPKQMKAKFKGDKIEKTVKADNTYKIEIESGFEVNINRLTESQTLLDVSLADKSLSHIIVPPTTPTSEAEESFFNFRAQQLEQRKMNKTQSSENTEMDDSEDIGIILIKESVTLPTSSNANTVTKTLTSVKNSSSIRKLTKIATWGRKTAANNRARSPNNDTPSTSVDRTTKPSTKIDTGKATGKPASKAAGKPDAGKSKTATKSFFLGGRKTLTDSLHNLQAFIKPKSSNASKATTSAASPAKQSKNDSVNVSPVAATSSAKRPTVVKSTPHSPIQSKVDTGRFKKDTSTKSTEKSPTPTNTTSSIPKPKPRRLASGGSGTVASTSKSATSSDKSTTNKTKESSLSPQKTSTPTRRSKLNRESGV